MATYYTSRYSGEEIDKLLDRASGMETNPAAALARLGAGVRPNLLDNPFFAVNQRGQTTYTTTGYTVDRWYLITSTETLMTVQADGVVLTASSQYGSYLNQIIPPEEVARLRGETVCFSAFCDQHDNAAWYANIYVNDQWRDSFALMPNTVSAKAYAVPEDAQRIHLSFGSNAAGSCKLRAAKVELGNTQTLGYQDEDGAWHLLPQPESDYATQLARCQRFFQCLTGESDWSCIGFAEADGTNDVILHIPIVVPMRTCPDIDFDGLYVNGVAITAIRPDQYNPTMLKFWATTTSEIPSGLHPIMQLGGGFAHACADL